ncbi:MAG: acetamidase [Methanobacteriota archaeon]|nr:acetamidase [Euryarchaeota archaeon]RAH06889.1 MAG: acetamidase [Euryarchaeota archaeon]|tara:strand:+ start:40 stop:1341 length:1302 start_codon:yes stop_codon:yes gene_type:complete
MTSENKGSETVYVNEFTDGVLDPEKPMLGPVRDGGHIIANTAPGCWGPMITPELRGGHEVTIPVEVEGAEVGDAIAIRIKDISVTSIATASGNDYWVDGLYMGDPYVAKFDPDNEELNPESYVEGIGEDAVKFKSTGKPASPFKFTNGYTIAFDNNRSLGVTVDKAASEKIAHDAKKYAAMPQNAIQHSILTFCPNHLVGLVARLRPFMGQLGTCPSIAMPDSHNAGDFGTFLVGAPHPQSINAEDLSHRTDGHMDIDAVRAGSILICPVKVPGGGIYMGDMHAMQGDGEIAGHTTDVSGTVTLQVHVLKGLKIDGPIIFPVEEDLPFLAKPVTEEERSLAEEVAREWGMSGVEDSVPISIVGSGPDLNAATENGLERAAELLGVTVPEIRNRATITGSIEIGRAPGVVHVTFLAPSEKVDELGLLSFANDMY